MIRLSADEGQTIRLRLLRGRLGGGLRLGGRRRHQGYIGETLASHPKPMSGGAVGFRVTTRRIAGWFKRNPQARSAGWGMEPVEDHQPPPRLCVP